jgi:hypothetical protein
MMVKKRIWREKIICWMICCINNLLGSNCYFSNITRDYNAYQQQHEWRPQNPLWHVRLGLQIGRAVDVLASSNVHLALPADDPMPCDVMGSKFGQKQQQQRP